MRLDKPKAILLRRQEKSFTEISNELGIPKSTLHYWFKDNEWSREIKVKLTRRAQVLARGNLRLMHTSNMKKWEKWHAQCREKAREEFPLAYNDQLFLAGLMLYWGEGDRVLKNGKVRLVNSNPNMIKLFYHCLQKSMNVPRDKIFIKLTLYPELEDDKYKKIWSKLLNVPPSQFQKSKVVPVVKTQI